MVPTTGALELPADRRSLGSEFFLEWSELGAINLGGPGTVRVDGKDWAVARLEGLYVGQGAERVEFVSQDPRSPAKYYLASGSDRVNESNPHACGFWRQREADGSSPI